MPWSSQLVARRLLCRSRDWLTARHDAQSASASDDTPPGCVFASQCRFYAPLVAVYSPLRTGKCLRRLTLPLFLVPRARPPSRLFAPLPGRDVSLADEPGRSRISRLERANLSFATALVATLDARDRYTAGHSAAAVSIYARDIAGAARDYPKPSSSSPISAGWCMTSGRSGWRRDSFEKPGALTLEERRQMQEHSAIGERYSRESRGLR